MRAKLSSPPVAAVAMALSALLVGAGCDGRGALETVAAFGDRQCTGVAVSRDGRVFVSFPNWSPGHDISVAEVMPDGTVRPYPDGQTNTWGPGDDPRDRFVCVQSVYIDTRDPNSPLWVLDSGNPRFEGGGQARSTGTEDPGVVPNAAKLVSIDLGANQITRAVRFDAALAPAGSYLNDVRTDAGRGFAYITDSGLGALVVVNLNTGRCRRVLEGHVSTRAEAGVEPVIGGRVWRQPDGTVPQVHADGIALSDDGETLYFKALVGRTLYRVSTSALRNFSMPDSILQQQVRPIGKAPVCDGMICDGQGNVYMTALEQDAIVVRRPDGRIDTVVRGDLLKWPDSLAISPAGDLLVTCSQIHLAPRFNAGQDNRQGPYTLYKLPGVAPALPAKPPAKTNI